MATLWELFVQVTGDSSSFKKSMKESGDSVLGFEKLVQESFTKIAGYFTAGAIVDGVLKIGEAFEKADIKIQRATGASGAKLEGLNESLKHLYVNSAQSAETIAGAMAKISQKTGATGKDLETLTAAELRFAKVTGSDVTSAVATNERVFSAWGVTTKQQTAALDVMYVATQKTGISAEQLSQSLITTGPALRNLGFGFKESVALIAQFEKAGLNADEMVMGLNQAFVKFAEAGKDPKRALAELIEHMGSAETRADALSLAMDAGFKARVAGRFVDSVRSGAFTLADLIKLLENSSGAVAEMAKKTDTLSDAWGKFTHQVSVSAAPAGEGILSFATKSLQGWSKIFSDLDGLKEKHPFAAVVLGLATNPQQRGMGSTGEGSGEESNFVFNPKTGGFDEQKGPLKAPVGDIGSATGGGAGTGGGALVDTDKMRGIKGLDDSLAVLVEREKQAQAAHAATISEIAKSGLTIDEFFTQKLIDAGNAQGELNTAAEKVPAIEDTYVALAKPIDEVNKLIGKLGKSIDETNQEALANSPYGQLAEAAQYFGITTSDEYEKIAKASESAFDKILKTGLATDRELAISALKMAQARLDADLAAGHISQEVYDKESARVAKDLAAWSGSLNAKETALQKWARKTQEIIGSVDKTFKRLSDMGGEAFNQLSRGMGANIADAIVYHKSISEAMQAALASVLESLAAQAIGYAIYATALGFLRLAQWDFVAAGNAFTSAAIWGAVGAVTAIAGAAVAPKQDKGGASAAGGWDEVPFDNYPTYLHAKEMVLPADIATPLRAQLRAGGVGGGGINIHFNGPVSGVTKDLVRSVFQSGIQQARFAGAKV